MTITAYRADAQSMGISNSSITPDASSILEMRTTTKGMLIPRMTTTERDAIGSPATGLMIYNSTTNKFNFYSGSVWTEMVSGTGSQNLQQVTDVGATTTNRVTVNGLKTNDYTDFANISEPAAPGATTARVYSKTDAGFTVMEVITPSGQSFRFMRDNVLVLKVKESGGITAGQVVYISGASGGTDECKLWIADGSISSEPIGIAVDAGSNNSSIRVMTLGKIYGLSTNGFTEGGNVYASASTAGAITATQPQHPNFNTVVGVISRSHPSLGEITITPFITRGNELGTKQNDFSIGTNTSGAKTMTLKNGFSGTLSANPTANRTWTLPDAGGTVAVSASGNIALSAAGDISFTGVLPVSNGGTGSSTQNWVDLTTNQTIAGSKTFSNIITGNAGLTVSGAANSINVNSSFATNINTGSSTGSITIGGTATQSIAVGTGAAVKTVSLGSNFTNSTTTILSGASGFALSLNASAGGAITNIGTGSTTGDVTIGNASNQVNLPRLTASKAVFTDASKNLTSTGTLAVDQGGTGVSTLTGIIKGNGTSAFTAATAGTDYSAGTSALATGILKSTTSTGALSIAVAGDFPTLNQNTTGSAATLTTSRLIYGGSFNGSADVTNVIASTYGGTGNGFAKFTGPATSEKTFTLPNVNATILTDNATVTVAQGGTGATTLTGIIKGNGTSAFTTAAAGTDYVAPNLAITGATNTKITYDSKGLVTAGSQAAASDLSNGTTGSGNIVLGTSPTLTTPTLGVASSTSQTITGTGGNGFLSLTAQSSNPSAPGSGTLLFSNASSRLSWKGSANTFVKTFDAASATADRTYTLPDANGTVAISASGNMALSAAGNITFTGVLPIANGGTNTTATPTAGGAVYGDGSAHLITAAGTTGQVLQSNGSSAPTWMDGGTLMLGGVSNNAAVNNTTLFFPLTGGIAGNSSDAQAGLRTLVSRAGTFKNLYVKLSAAIASGKTGTVTIMKNGVATSLVVTLSVGPVDFSDLSNSFTVAAGDEIGVRVTTTGNVKFSWAVDFTN